MAHFIRQATPEDRHDIVEMALRFYENTYYNDRCEAEVAQVYNIVNSLIDGEHVLLVIDGGDGVLYGMICLFIVPFLFNTQRMQAHEVCLWVDEDIHGGGWGRKLLVAAEAACKDRGADAVQMIALASSPPHIMELYKRMGYRQTEHTFVKEI